MAALVTMQIHTLIASPAGPYHDGSTILVLLLLLAVPPTAFTTTDVYYVTAHDAAGHEQSCPPHQICHNLSYYISQPDSYFISDTTIIFLEGEHSFDRENLVHVSNVHNLTLKGQGQWPVAGAEETVMQSTVIINCARGRGGFYFGTSHNITVEGLTVVNCGGVAYFRSAVFNFSTVQNLLFHKNSIQHMKGYGLRVYNCDNVIVTNCSYYHSAVCINKPRRECYGIQEGGAVSIIFKGSTQYSNTLELSHSNMTKCIDAENFSGGGGGGVSLQTQSGFGSATVVLSHLILSQNSASDGGGNLAALLYGNGKVTLNISNCLSSHGFGLFTSGGMYFDVQTHSSIIIQNTKFVENILESCGNHACGSELYYRSRLSAIGSFSVINSNILHTENHSFYGVTFQGCCPLIKFINTRIIISKQIFGFYALGYSSDPFSNYGLQINDSQFEGSQSGAILYTRLPQAIITNCTFSNNTGGQSVIVFDSSNGYSAALITNSIISDNNMTGIIIKKGILSFIGRNVIQNNRDTEGAGIELLNTASIEVRDGELHLYNNTADKQGGAILVRKPILDESQIQSCTIGDFGKLFFSGNRAGRGGSDVYGAILMGCDNNDGSIVPHVGQPNEISWYFDTPIMKHLHFSNTERLSSMSSDSIMVCFCNNSNLPDCSDRTHHMQTYPGLEINTSIATVGYYGGTSPGDVLVSAQHATLVRYYGQNLTTNCFQLHILLQNTSSTTALVDIRVDGGLQGWGVSIGVDILECPIGFIQISGQCHCDHFLDTSNVQCNLSSTPFLFLRSGNSWFAYNNTQCITGTTNCPFDYCNRSNVSFDIMAPDRQCVANRVGILCGQCQSHLSIMLGSNHCGTCSNWYLFLLPMFALAGIVLVAVLMFLNFSVSIGTINGLLFYANMVKLNKAFFFPNGSVPVVNQFISWLNLDLGIEVCLFDGLDGYWKTWLQFAFPAYLFLLMGGIIVGCRYSVWLCRLCGSHAVPALATLFLTTLKSYSQY